MSKNKLKGCVPMDSVKNFVIVVYFNSGVV